MTTATTIARDGAPDVSVIMPAWNAEVYIDAAIDSVLASQGVSFELIIVDDASPDNTYELLQRRAAGDSRIRIDRLKSNRGPSAARNRALEMARGRYIAVIDSDDQIAVSRLTKLVALAETSGADIIVDNMVETDAKGGRLARQHFLKSAAFATPRDITIEDYVHYNLPMKARDCLGYLKPLFRRQTLDRLGARYDTDLRNSEDYYLIAHLLASGARMTYTPYAGYFYRRAEGSTSHRLRPEHTAAWLRAEDEFCKAHLDNLDVGARRELKTRARTLNDVDQMTRAIDAIKRRRFDDLLKLLIADPRATLYTCWAFAGIARQRIAAVVRPAPNTQTASL